MPKLWDATIESHRQAVRQAVVDAAWALVREHGLLSVTMSRIAAEAGVGRATLYKYFTDVESILVAWHEQRTAEHLAELRQLANRDVGAMERLRAVFAAYARITRSRGSHPEVAALLHKGDQADHAQQQLTMLVRDLLAAACARGHVRGDVPAGELAHYCVHALGAAAGLPSNAAVERLVDIVLDSVRGRG